MHARGRSLSVTCALAVDVAWPELFQMASLLKTLRRNKTRVREDIMLCAFSHLREREREKEET